MQTGRGGAVSGPCCDDGERSGKGGKEGPVLGERKVRTTNVYLGWRGALSSRGQGGRWQQRRDRTRRSLMILPLQTHGLA